MREGKGLRALRDLVLGDVPGLLLLLLAQRADRCHAGDAGPSKRKHERDNRNDRRRGSPTCPLLLPHCSLLALRQRRRNDLAAYFDIAGAVSRREEGALYSEICEAGCLLRQPGGFE